MRTEVNHMNDELVKIAEDSARGGFFLISGTALATAVMSIAAVLVGRFIGSELYGQYTLVIVIPELFFLFTDLGINQGITKFTADLNSKNEIGRLATMMKYALVIKASVGFVIFAVTYVWAEVIASALLQRPDLAFYVRVASVSVLFQVMFAVATSAFVGFDKTEYNALTTNVQAFVKTVVSITLVLLGFSVAGAVLGYVASYVVAATVGGLILLLFLSKRRVPEKHHDVKKDLRVLMNYGTPLYVSVLLTGLIPLYSKIVLANFVTDTEIGNYKQALNFATLMTVLSIPITTALLPAFSKLDLSANQKIKTFFKLANKYTAMLIIPVTVLIIVYSSEIVQIILGSEYQLAGSFLATQSLVYFLVGIGYITLAGFYNGLGETKTTMIIGVITFSTLGVLCPILVQAFKVQGAIMAFLIASTAGTVYGMITARKKFGVEYDTLSLLKIYSISLISAIPSVLMLVFLPLPRLANFVVGSVLYLLIYATLAPITRIVTMPELEMAERITQKINLLSFIAKPILKYERRVLQWSTKHREN